MKEDKFTFLNYARIAKRLRENIFIRESKIPESFMDNLMNIHKSIDKKIITKDAAMAEIEKNVEKIEKLLSELDNIKYHK